MEQLTIPAIASYLVDQPVFPYCKGCGHTMILRKLNEALVSLQLPLEKTVLVTDIGCIGLADKMFRDIHTVHTTHGRSTAFATGIALGGSVLRDTEAKIIVLIGDGGAMIGMQHLVHAAMLNVDVTVLICNNFVYGMTGGQGSGLTPECFVTSTTPDGNSIPPADLCGILRHSNAPWVARTFATEGGLSSLLAEAIAFPGFSAVEILELCTEYAVPWNHLNGQGLKAIAQKNGWEVGRLVERRDRKTFSIGQVPEAKAKESGPGQVETIPHRRSVQRPLDIVIAGSAGEHIQSSTGLLCRVALKRGYYVTQKNDNPVTQGSGFSLSEARISPCPIEFTGIENPDVIVVVSEDGWHEVMAAGWLAKAGSVSSVFVDESVARGVDQRGLTRYPFLKIFGPGWAATGSLLWVVARRGVAEAEEFLKEVKGTFGEEAARIVAEAYDRFLSHEASDESRN